MHVLAVNWGSSSLKCALVDASSGSRVREHRWSGAISTPADAAARACESIAELMTDLPEQQRPQAFAHRVVHGGKEFRRPVIVDDATRARLAAVEALAPLHNPPAFAVLDALRERWSAVPHVAVFDTTFHSTLPARARSYALPSDLTERLQLERFGFHGLSHAHVRTATSHFLRAAPTDLRIISCHLGNGASAAAIEQGACTETSMGMTPLEGLVMGTRAGDLDPGVVLAIVRAHDGDLEAVERLLNRAAGLAGLTGTQDIREIEERAARGDERCRLALAVYGHRVRKYIGAYAAVMGGVDVIAFTGGIGEHSAEVRSRCLQRLVFLGAMLDEDRNRDASVSPGRPVCDISDTGSRVRLLVVAADEEGQMAAETAELLAHVPADDGTPLDGCR